MKEDVMRKAANENVVQFVKTATKDFPKRDFAAFVDWNIDIMNSFPNNKAATFEIVKKTDQVLELKVTECLAARILREMNAADIGYVTICDPDGASAREFNPKIKAANPKNFMKGDDVCIGRYVIEA